MATENVQEQAPSLTGIEFQGKDFASLLKGGFKPTTEVAETAVQKAVMVFAQQALTNANLRSGKAVESVQAMIAEIDKRLTAQVNLILHHADFQKLEGAWRGLAHLVNNTETDEMLKIRVMNISKDELRSTLEDFPGVAWDQSHIFKKVYEEEYGMLGGSPFGCLVGDYEFDQTPPDVTMLSAISKISAAAHAPFITAASPKLIDRSSWQDLAKPRDLTKIFETDQYIPWRALRDADESRYLGLTMPRFLGRLPYDPVNNPVKGFTFTEAVHGGDHASYTWCNSAYAMAVNINRSFKLYGWCSKIRGVEAGGAVPNLPVHTFPTDDGGTDSKCPTEIAITDRREAELAKNGFMPLVYRKKSDMAAFIGAQSLHKPKEFDDPDATANENLSARLQYLFACCRFAHYLKCIVRDKIGTSMERGDMESFLRRWIKQYTLQTPALATEEEKAKKPLAAAEVTVAEVEGNPGYYTSKFSLRPHYQVEGLTVSLSLVSRLPSAKK